MSPGAAASADRTFDAIPPTATDVPARSGPPVVGPAGFRSSWDLDGLYLWLGPTGNATYVDRAWDTAFGGDLAVLRVQEHEALGALGGEFGFSKFTAHDGGRVWVDAIVGTRISGRAMAGLSLGPVLEVSDTEHARAGASVGAWAFVGVTPYVRIGAIADRGEFVEIGLHIALPVFRR